MTYALWIVQGLLALLFLYAGGMKLVLPIEEMTQQMELPGWFLRFIGVCEVLGALGLVLPGLARVRQGLTPLAAAGLAVVLLLAALTHLRRREPGTVAFNAVLLVLVALVAWGRFGPYAF